ncbi:MAG: hypothetical protein KDK12_17970 [Rhodobacteraceae bacterium]|nr:hypothetical protein [Paracoccaceae bacterium]
MAHLVRPQTFCHRLVGAVKDFVMPESQKKRMGRPPVNSTPVTVRLPPDLLTWIDTERAKLDPEPSRPEFIRQVLEDRRG